MKVNNTPSYSFEINTLVRKRPHVSLAILLLFFVVPVLSVPYQTYLSRHVQNSAAETAASQANLNRAKMPTPDMASFQKVDVYRLVNREPAPMGMADYGIGPGGPYEYATNSTLGVVTINSLSTRGSRRNTNMTVQLNVNLMFAVDNVQYVYWIQNVAYLDTSSRVVSFIDNVWNSSSPTASMLASGISGNGTVASSGSAYFYYCVANGSLPGNNIPLVYPATFTLNVTSQVSSSGQPAVSFAYDDGYGLITYDTVTFTAAHGLQSLTGFEVNGFSYDPLGLFYDSELILGGPGGGSQTTDLQSDVQLQLEYWNGHNYDIVANAYNFGSNTGERIGNVLAQFSHRPESGTIIAEIQSGAGEPAQLYNESQIGIVNITSSLASGTLSVTNASNPTATPREYPFVNGQVAVTLYPGYYNLQLHFPSGEIYDQRNLTLDAGQNLVLQAPFNASTHDVAVTSVAATKTVIGEGLSGNITVHVANKGQYTETFNVTVYSNTTAIGTQQVIDLNATGEKVLTFTWNTTGFARGDYTIDAHAQLVPGETNTLDNNLTSSRVIVLSIPGDINGDGKVNIEDITTAAQAFGSQAGEKKFQPNADLNEDGTVSILDIFLIADEFGKTI